MSLLPELSLTLDLAVIGLTIAMFSVQPRIGGTVGRGVRILTLGFLVLGGALLTETGLLSLSGLDFQTVEVFHHLLIGIGFGVITWGFDRMRRALR